MSNIEKYEHLLVGADMSAAESVFQRVADSYEDDLLEHDDLPDEYFQFFLRLLSEAQFFDKPGLWNFFLVFGTEGHKLNHEHYSKIAQILLANFHEYKDEQLRLAACDFVARNYEDDHAEKVLTLLSAIERKHGRKNLADDGFAILECERKRQAKR